METFSPAPQRREAWIIRLAMLAAFAVTLALSVIHNDFPFAYHPDEPSKVEQVITGARNFNHPPLLLTLTRAVMDAAGIAPRPQNAARTGRCVSAVALALAAAALTWLAGVYGGSGGAICAAAALATDTQAALAGHFFKEDALLALGLALTVCAGAWHGRRRDGLSLLALGAAAGLALSAKYVGVLAGVYALALGAVMARDARARWLTLGGCLAAAAAVFLGLNGGALLGHWAEWQAGLTRGAAVTHQGNESVGAGAPHLQFVGMFFWFTPLPVLAGAAVFWADLRRRPFRLNADRWLAGLAPLGLVAAFSFSASTAVRYYLPVSLLLDCIAGAALPGGTRFLLEKWRWLRRGEARPVGLPVGVGVAAVLLFTVPQVSALLGGFTVDDRAALRGWIAQNLPPAAVVAEDALARLEDAPENGGGTLFPRVLARPCVADLGDVAALRAQGITHVVVCWYDSGRYIDASKRPAPEAAADFERRRAFYLGLPAHAQRLWKKELRQPYALRPGLELFALALPPQAASSTR